MRVTFSEVFARLNRFSNLTLRWMNLTLEDLRREGHATIIHMRLPEKIEADRCTLRGLREPSFDMAEKLYAKVNASRDRLCKWLPWVDTIRSVEDEYTRYLVEWCRAHWSAGIGFAYAIVLKGTEQVLGCIDIFNISWEDKSGEIGYWLGDDAVGCGYMQEAVQALEAEAFAAGLHRIVIKNDVNNLRSIHVAKRCGYVLEQILHKGAWNGYLRDPAVWIKAKGAAGRLRISRR